MSSKNFVRGCFLTAGLAAAACMTTPAQAHVVTTGSASFTELFDNPVANNPDLKGSLSFSNFVFNTAAHTFTTTLSIANTTAAAFSSARLTAFGFNTDPNATTASDTSADWSVTLNTTFPGFQTVDVCLWAGQNCSGGGNAGLLPGQSTTFNLTLSGLPNGTTSIDLGSNGGAAPETFYVKYQTGVGSFEFENTKTNTPEPASMAILGVALMGMGVTRLRKKPAQS
jgi:hypothetical protein